MLDKVAQPDSVSYPKFLNLVPGCYKSHNVSAEKKHNGLQNILTGVKLSSAGAAV